MRSFLKRVSSALLCAALAFASVFAAGCGKDDNKKPEVSGLTEIQSRNILAICEAFIESGKNYNSENALTITDMEKFVYYLYNAELEAAGDGYARVSEADAAARIKAYFGVETLMHVRRNLFDANFDFADGSYIIRPNSPAVTSSVILSNEPAENENRAVTVEVDCADGGKAKLELIVKLSGDNVRVITCSRFDEK